MFYKTYLSVLFLLAATTMQAQKLLKTIQEKPQAGELISFIYEPAGEIARTTAPVKVVIGYKKDGNNIFTEQLLTKEGNKFKGSFQTEASQSILFLTFQSGEKDDNSDGGYVVQLYEGSKIKKTANAALALMYFDKRASVDSAKANALKYFEQEMTLYPETRDPWIFYKIALLSATNKQEKPALVQKEIEKLLAEGLKTEDDYKLLEGLYKMGGQLDKEKMTNALKKEKYPNGKWAVAEARKNFNAEKDPVKKQELLAEMLKKAETDEYWKELKKAHSRFNVNIVEAYIEKRDWEGLKGAIIKSSLDQQAAATCLANAARIIARVAGEDTLRKYGEPFAHKAATYFKNEWLNPTNEKPAGMTKESWDKSRGQTYASSADTYASILYKIGEYKNGLPYAKDAAVVIAGGQNLAFNTSFARLAEKISPAGMYTKDLEHFVQQGKANNTVYNTLQQLYVKEHGSEAGYNDYISSLQQKNYSNVLTRLRSSMLSKPASSFALKDLDGNTIDLAAMKGKVVVIDFWATWCGPCIASFPGMQKVVNKYKDSDDVKFLFISTFEKVEDKKKKVTDFMSKSKFNFQVLLDEDNKVVKQYGINAIPHKFVIDKNGIIRFKAAGSGGTEDALVNELSAMIQLAGEAGEGKQ